jgi:hypothetical protein
MNLRFLICLVAASTLRAQEQQEPLVTRTIPLRYLQAVDAARLISPYVRSPKGGVYEATAVRAVTVTETASTIARIDSIIRENDRSPAVLTFRFQLIAGDDTPGVDSAIEPLATTLHGLFRYKGYHLIGEGSASAGETANFSLTMAGGQDRFSLNGEVDALQVGNNGAVRIRVWLGTAPSGTFEGKPAGEEKLLSTGLTIPLGQTVVLGSAAPGGSNKALILAVRPDVAIAPRR